MKNAKALFFSALLSITGAALADGCSSCPSCPAQPMVCNADGCSIAGVEAEPTKAKKAKSTKDAEEVAEDAAVKEGALEEAEADVAPEAEGEISADLEDKE